MSTEPSPRGPIIVASNLSRTYSVGGAQQHVLRNLDLEIARGSFTVIMGPSGSGKSTLLHALSGMDRPSLGTITVDGVEISEFSEDRLARFRRDRCGMVFQQAHLLDALTVMDNVLAVGLLGGRSRRAVSARARELFDLVGIPERDTRKRPSMLSGGEAQRAAIVRALIREPAVLFADEPTGQLNSEFSEIVLNVIGEIHQRGQTVVMVTHDPRTASRADRIFYLRDGAIEGELTLPPYAGEDPERHQRVTGFLTERGW